MDDPTMRENLRVADEALMDEREREIQRVYAKDAPEGMAWKCPDCERYATLGGNAGYHAIKTEHGVPTLMSIDDAYRLSQKQMGIIERSWDKPFSIHLYHDGREAHCTQISLGGDYSPLSLFLMRSFKTGSLTLRVLRVEIKLGLRDKRGKKPRRRR